jgi:hypothetical protein
LHVIFYIASRKLARLLAPGDTLIATRAAELLRAGGPQKLPRNAKSGANSGSRFSASLVAPPSEQAAAREDQAGQSSADTGTRDGNAIERKGRVKRSLVSNVGADPQPIGGNTSITLISCPALKIGGAEGEGRSRRNDRLRCGEPKKVPIR